MQLLADQLPLGVEQTNAIFLFQNVAISVHVLCRGNTLQFQYMFFIVQEQKMICSGGKGKTEASTD